MLPIMKPLVRSSLTRAIVFAKRMQSQRAQNAKVPPKILRLQKKFQEKNDLPVFLKGGASDRILYYTTLGLSGFGLLSCIALFAGYIID